MTSSAPARPRYVAVDGLRSLVYLMDQIARKDRKIGRTCRRCRRARKCLGVEFIEFAVDDQTAAGLAKLFGALGFRNAGTAQVQGR